jgi:aspartate kinase
VAVKILVQKFGGTSVDTPEHRAQAVQKVLDGKRRGYRVVAVISAIGRRGAPYATDTLLDELRGIDAFTKPLPREQDLIISCGEIISTVLFTQHLRSAGVESLSLTGGQAGIVTDYSFGQARILSIDAGYIKYQLEQGRTVCVAGFQGQTERPSPRMHGAITTLGRGGSDTTASALGAALGAELVEIYTDVDGVMTADPRIVPEARTLETVGYDEVAEMAHQGAKVLHPRAAELAMANGIPLRVRSTFSDYPGTLLVRAEQTDGNEKPFTAVVTSPSIVYLRFQVGKSVDRSLVEREIFKLMANRNIPVHMVTTKAEGFSFAVERSYLDELDELLDALVIPVDLGRETGRIYLFNLLGRSRTFASRREVLERGSSVEISPVAVEVDENCVTVSIIAAGYQEKPGVVARVWRILMSEGTVPRQVTNSPMSLSFLLSSNEAGRAARALHRELIS